MPAQVIDSTCLGFSLSARSFSHLELASLVFDLLRLGLSLLVHSQGAPGCDIRMTLGWMSMHSMLFFYSFSRFQYEMRCLRSFVDFLCNLRAVGHRHRSSPL